MNLWMQWYRLVRSLQVSCGRRATFLSLVLTLYGFTLSDEREGVSGLMRSAGLGEKWYKRLLHFFNDSRALSLERLTRTWVDLVGREFRALEIAGRVTLVGDGLKIPKEGRKMPGVKSLHQESSNNTKPPFIMGHSFQSLSLLAQGPAGALAAVPLLSRIHEGTRRTPRDRRTLPDRLLDLVREVHESLKRPLRLVADAFYAKGRLMKDLQKEGHHLLTRAKKNIVAYRPAPLPARRKRGRPKKYGEKVTLFDLFASASDWIQAPSPLPGEKDVTLAYRAEILLWKPAGQALLFVWVKHPAKGNVVLMTTEVELPPLEVIRLYGARFGIEGGFRDAIHTLGTFAYRFWMKEMERWRRGDGDRYLHKKSEAYRRRVQRKEEAYHRFVQCGTVAQGLLVYLALYRSEWVWESFRTWYRTLNRNRAPSVRVVHYALRYGLGEFRRDCPPEHELQKILEENLDVLQVPELQRVA